MMPQADPHIIERVVLDVQTDRGSYATQEAFAEWLKGTALPAIDKLWDELIPTGERWRVDRLDIDLGYFRSLDLSLPGQRAALLERLLYALRSRLGEQLAEGKARVATPHSFVTGPDTDLSLRVTPVLENRPFTAWLFFLEYGHLPWWAGAFPPASKWSEDLLAFLTGPERLNQRRSLLALIERSPQAVLRLVGDSRHTLVFKKLALEDEVRSEAWGRWKRARA
ncbi:MAG: contractile injection system tape measure protein, partial [Lewinella sp.]